MKPLLLLVQPRQGPTGARVDVRLNSGGSAAAAGLGGFRWESAVQRRPRLTQELLAPALDGRIQVGRGDFVINLGNIKAVPTTGLYWPGAPVTIYDARGLDLLTAPVEFQGFVRRSEFDVATGMLTLNLEVSTEVLDKPVLTAEFSGAGGANGQAEMRGKLKPAGFGTVQNVEPIWFDTVRNIGMLDGYGNLQVIANLFEGGNQFGPAVFNYNTYADLAAAIDAKTVPPGRWAACTAEGLIGLGAPPVKPITCDCVFGTNRPGALIRRLMEVHAGVPVGDVDTAAFTALDAAVNRPVHHWMSEARSVKDLCEAIAASCNATLLRTFQGKFSVARAFGGANIATFDRQKPTADRRVTQWRALDAEPPTWRMKMRAMRPGVVLTTDQILYEDDLIDLGLYDAAKVYRQGNLVWNAAGAQFLYINGTPAAGNAPPAHPTLTNAHWERTKPPTTGADLFYADGTPFENLKPAQAGADKTSTNTAQYIQNQGALAVKSSVDLATTEVTNKSLANVDAPASTKLGTITEGAGRIQTLYDISTAPAGASITGNTAIRTGGPANDYNSAVRADPMRGPCYAEIDLNSGSDFHMVSLDDDATSTAFGSITAMAQHFSGHASGWTYLYINGSLQGSAISAPATSGKLRVLFDGARLRVLVNGVETHNVAAPAGLLGAIWPKWTLYNWVNRYTGFVAGLIGDIRTFRDDGSTVLTQAQIITAEGTAAYIANQGALATAAAADYATQVTGAEKPESLATAGDNLIRNAGLRANAEHWTINTNASRVVGTIAGDPPAFIRTTASGAGAFLNLYGHTPIEGGKTYFIEMLGRSNAAGNFGTMDGQIFDGAGTPIDNFTLFNTVASANAWQRAVTKKTVPANAASVRFQVTGYLYSGGTSYDIAMPRFSAVEAGATVGADVNSVNLVDSYGGSYQVLPRDEVRTPLGTALYIQNQGALAIRSNVEWATHVASRPALLTDTVTVDGLERFRANYIRNVSENSYLTERWPQELNANRTETRTALYIANQGDLAIRSTVEWATHVASRPAMLTNTVNVDGAERVRAEYIREPISGSYLSGRWPQEAGANVTETRTAQYIQNQGAWAIEQRSPAGVFNGSPNLIPNGSLRLVKAGNIAQYWVHGSGWSLIVGGGTEGNYLAIGGGGTSVSVSEGFIPLYSSIPYSIQAELFAGGMSAGVLAVDVEFYDSGNNILGYSPRITATNGQTWTKKFASFTTPAGTVKGKVRTFIEAATNTSAGVRRLKLAAGSLETPFSDEASVDADLLMQPGTGRQVGDMRNLPRVTANNLGYKFTGAVSYSADSSGNATISVGAGSILSGVSVPYNAMSQNVSGGTPGGTTNYHLYVDEPDPANIGNTKPLVATSDGMQVYQNTNRVWIGSVAVAFPSSGTGAGSGGGGGGGGGGTGFPEP